MNSHVSPLFSSVLNSVAKAQQEPAPEKVYPFTTVALPDGVVVGGLWPHTTVAWPGGKGRGATKPEYDLFQALEKAVEHGTEKDAALTRSRDLISQAIDQLQELSSGTRDQRVADLISSLRSGLEQIEEAL